MNQSVTIYSTPSCGYCKAAKEYMTKNGIDFTDINVEADQERAKEMIEKSGQMGVPVIVIGEGADERVIIGFDQQRLSEAFGTGE